MFYIDANVHKFHSTKFRLAAPDIVSVFLTYKIVYHCTGTEHIHSSL